MKIAPLRNTFRGIMTIPAIDDPIDRLEFAISPFMCLTRDFLMLRQFGKYLELSVASTATRSSARRALLNASSS
jgi:hypothetical protein